MADTATTIQGALFDLDGLILDTEAVGMEAFSDVTGPMGMDKDRSDEIYLTLIGLSGETANARISALFPDEDTDRIDRLWIAAMARRLEHDVPMRPTAFETIWELHRNGLPMAIVTSSRRRFVAPKLERVGLRECFAALVTANDVAQRKPHPEPYLQGAAHLGLPPGRCAAFEDSDTGTRAAVAAGCVTFQIPDLRPLDTPFPLLGQRHASTLREAVEQAGLL
ncbi:MAG: HAD family phosphatase [Pseudomonadota bacterium]